jgi:hypothetical protein
MIPYLLSMVASPGPTARGTPRAIPGNPEAATQA